jgi:hypothetical protein
MIGTLGLLAGIRTGLVITIVLVAITFPLLWTINLPASPRDTIRLRGVWNSLHPLLKRLLISDIAIRTCEGMADIFVILYVTNVTRVSIPRYGILVAIPVVGYAASGVLVERVEEIFCCSTNSDNYRARTQRFEVLWEKLLPKLFAQTKQKNSRRGCGHIPSEAKEMGDSLVRVLIRNF